MAVVVGRDGSLRPRKQRFEVLLRVRAFYLDIQEWALQDPSWVAWAVPSPVRKSHTEGQIKLNRQTASEMHQRVRERLPHLPVLVDVAERHLAEQTALLAAATAVAVGGTFEHGGTRYRRAARKSHDRTAGPERVLVEEVGRGRVTDVLYAESDAFWSWAVVEILRHTGVRVEELLELTHLALVSYRLPGTGETVPLLQIVPSKSNEERLLPID